MKAICYMQRVQQSELDVVFYVSTRKEKEEKKKQCKPSNSPEEKDHSSFPIHFKCVYCPFQSCIAKVSVLYIWEL